MLRPARMSQLYAFEILVDWPRSPGLHVHPRHLEWFACLDGRGKQYLDDRIYPAQSGELYLLPAGRRHISSGQGNGLLGLVVNATPEAVPSGAHELNAILSDLHAQVQRQGPRVPLSAAGFRTVTAAMRRIADEGRERRPGHVAATTLAYGELLLAIRRDPLAESIPFRTHPVDAGERIRHLCGWLAETFRGDVTVEQMARMAGLSRTVLHERFQAIAGATPRAYLERLRLDEAERQLRETAHPITDIALSSGFGSLSQFYAAFHRRSGVAPQRWRDANAATHP
jgi:AraC-like DNA-binding protein/mannose-6-phosphate isomerase-like protein (cupin superfamily)